MELTADDRLAWVGNAVVEYQQCISPKELVFHPLRPSTCLGVSVGRCDGVPSTMISMYWVLRGSLSAICGATCTAVIALLDLPRFLPFGRCLVNCADGADGEARASLGGEADARGDGVGSELERVVDDAVNKAVSLLPDQPRGAPIEPRGYPGEDVAAAPGQMVQHQDHVITASIVVGKHLGAVTVAELTLELGDAQGGHARHPAPPLPPGCPALVGAHLIGVRPPHGYGKRP
jgi:hypothetical protein